MKTYIDIQNWQRREHFEYFTMFEDPYFGFTAQIDCTGAFETAKQLQRSFFLHYLYLAQLCVNKIPAFRYRIENNAVAEYSEVHVLTTIGRPTGAFAYGFVEHTKNYNVFAKAAQEEIAIVQQSTGLRLESVKNRYDMVHFSSVPGINFTAAQNARSKTSMHSIPKIMFGKFVVENNRKHMPISVNMHHALADGADCATFFELLQIAMNNNSLK